MTPDLRRILGLSTGGFHEVTYREWGAADADQVLICVHGLTRNGRDFDFLARKLCDRFRVLCPDVVGRGDSGRLADPAGYGFPQYLADMTALLARSGAERVDWLGTSMGGLIGMMLAAQPKSPIRRLIVNDVGPFLPAAALRRIADYVGKAVSFADMAEAEAYMRVNYATFGPLSDAEWRHLTDCSVVEDEEGRLVRSYDLGIAQAFAGQDIEDVDLWPVWDAISCPTLVIRGAQSDLLTAKTAAQMTERGPRADLIEVPDCGHAPALMSDEQIAIVARWLEEHPV